MRTIKVLAVVALIISLSANVAFAAPGTNTTTQQQQTDTVKKDKKEIRKKKEGSDGQQDPIKALENKKERVRALLKEGKIEKEKADKITAGIDARIKKIREFNSLNLQQKKDRLISNYKAFIEKRVKSGDLSQDKATDMIAKYTDKVSQWDGAGYPWFVKKGLCGKCSREKGDTGK